jgi:hypothetical protein
MSLQAAQWRNKKSTRQVDKICRVIYQGHRLLFYLYNNLLVKLAYQGNC